MTNEELAAIRDENERGKAAIEWCAYGHDETEREARAMVDRLLAEVERLTKCAGCGKPRSLGVCSGYCDNDE